jgi:beta-galactosidase
VRAAARAAAARARGSPAPPARAIRPPAQRRPAPPPTPQDRFYWYAAHFLPDQPLVWLLPQNWNWEPSVTPAMDVWVYSNAASVELFLNGASLGARNMTQYGHAEWDKVPTTPGSLHAVGSDAAGAVVAEAWVNTTGPAAGLRISVKDGAYVGGADGTMVARCNDAALVQVEVVDASGAVVPTASNNISFALAGTAVPGVTLAGTSNGDPACLVNSKSPWRPAFHGLVMAVVIAGDSAGTVTVTASSPGFQTVSVQLPVVAASPAQAAAWWCRAAGARA